MPKTGRNTCFLIVFFVIALHHQWFQGNGRDFSNFFNLLKTLNALYLLTLFNCKVFRPLLLKASDCALLFNGVTKRGVVWLLLVLSRKGAGQALRQHDKCVSITSFFKLF
jgi:hypothetical protein